MDRPTEDVNKESSGSRKWPLLSQLSEDSLRKFKRKSKPTMQHWGTFCKSTSIHGMRYIVEPGINNSSVDRLWWVIVVVVGLLTAGYYTSRQYVKWTQSTIDADNSDDQAPMFEIPFPAFTICDNRKINSNLDENSSDLDQNLMYLLCGDDRAGDFTYDEEQLFSLIPPMNVNCTLMLVRPDDPDQFTSNCDSLMMRILTDQGVCYTFNMVDPHEIFKEGVEHGHSYHGRSVDWDMINGYRKGAKMHDVNNSDALLTGPFPKRGDNAVLLRIHHENDSTPQYCYGESDGFKIIFHNPDEFPMVGNRENPWVELEKKTKDKYIVLPSHKRVILDFKTRKIVPSENMGQFDSKQRKCYFPGEKELAYFKKYSYNNCQHECLTNLTKKNCKCIDYYMPRKTLPGDPEGSEKVCSSKFDIECIIYSFDMWDRRRELCSCLPACTTIEYDIVAWYSNRESDKPVGHGQYEGLLASDIILYSTEEEYVKSERRATYTRVDFIADCGGVFGLFCGMSIISIVEFAYYGVLWVVGRTR